ncbi:hypothetical protein HWB39_gp37 [Streptomyces phage WRightOn]|uniref:Uncharacterized protein n=4 Tax=Caudoviricetes TaxID=2731619 RepID=A0A2H4PI68_9CAUD|nr:hypothetical protein HWB39_gp37 [Streptomyces phage WRightOn]YP_009856801.1 hypothetical protein HWD10_gp29 [Streptomyces phage JXY1]QNN98983.1 hypothetical protein SEA_ZEIGLE_61 [Streptomyces phage Zeigle]WNA15469.1 hypothetical protein SEA_KUMQUAT_61 [Streptomyces phage Kumquat]ATW62499.1 hypothetical protein SEA_WRIGHTON_65 [Streptomyces phage WRightOn]QIA28848.1 hypothetical protein [Streptomyces phage JXY1]
MSDVDDILGGSKTPPGLKFETVGTKHVILVTEPPKSVPVREFINGKPAERLYFQSQKKVRESELNLNLPYEPIPAILVIGQTKAGDAVSVRLEGEKLKATRRAVREGGKLVEGAMFAIEYTKDDPESKGPFPKKLYTVQIKNK